MTSMTAGPQCSASRMVELEPVESFEDVEELRALIRSHHQFTGSTVAENILAQWPDVLDQFVKVMPIDYKRVLMEQLRKGQEVEVVG